MKVDGYQITSTYCNRKESFAYRESFPGGSYFICFVEHTALSPSSMLVLPPKIYFQRAQQGVISDLKGGCSYSSPPWVPHASFLI